MIAIAVYLFIGLLYAALASRLYPDAVLLCLFCLFWPVFIIVALVQHRGDFK